MHIESMFEFSVKSISAVGFFDLKS